ncbi:DUF3017 domain-containing protein [Aeromicrobium sp.]|uniref:DUF3017 domain-containing protein n=1 Tax=Aeromicrobium sp. TaxID=1871063 RepID=UPI0028AF8761|nr:DUF3017 domain-containing protein [Aeromicrobium sp.]
MKLPRSNGSRIYLLHLLAVAVGLALIATGPWRAGVMLIGVSFLVAAAFRTVIPLNHTGMLRVRGKVFDVVWMGFLGASLVVLALIVPS